MRKKETVLDVLREIRDLLKNRLLAVTITAGQLIDGRFQKLNDGWVRDNLFGIEWGPTLSKRMTWQEANDECKKMGARLPTRKELESLVDIKKYNPAINTDIFPDTRTDDWYWTGDTCAWDSGYAWVVRFNGGGVDDYSKGYNGFVRPVRSSQ